MRDEIPPESKGMPCQRTPSRMNDLIITFPVSHLSDLGVILNMQTSTPSSSLHILTQVRLGQHALTFPDELWLWVYLYVPHSTVCACVQRAEKRGHSMQWSDDWAADTGKKEANRRRKKGRERCRSLPNCQWVIAVEHTHTHPCHYSHHWSCTLNVWVHLRMASNLWTCLTLFILHVRTQTHS